jgi:hypothetical protein
VVETVFKVCPEDGAKLFCSMISDVVKAVVDGEVCSPGEYSGK